MDSPAFDQVPRFLGEVLDDSDFSEHKSDAEEEKMDEVETGRRQMALDEYCRLHEQEVHDTPVKTKSQKIREKRVRALNRRRLETMRISSDDDAKGNANEHCKQSQVSLNGTASDRLNPTQKQNRRKQRVRQRRREEAAKFAAAQVAADVEGGIQAALDLVSKQEETAKQDIEDQVQAAAMKDAGRIVFLLRARALKSVLDKVLGGVVKLAEQNHPRGVGDFEEGAGYMKDGVAGTTGISTLVRRLAEEMNILMTSGDHVATVLARTSTDATARELSTAIEALGGVQVSADAVDIRMK